MMGYSKNTTHKEYIIQESITTDFTESNRLRKRAHQIIPEGCHTYAKGDDQYPELSPGFISRGEGCHVFDLDGNEYIEYGMGLSSVTLGHGNKRIAKAAYNETLNGVNFLKAFSVKNRIG